MDVRIDWTRCTRRRWPAVPKLAFMPQERRKQKNVLLYWWAGRGIRSLPSGMVAIRRGMCHWSRPGWTYTCAQSPTNPLGVNAIHFDLVDRSGRILPPDSVPLPPEQLRVRDPGVIEEVTRWIAERALNVRAGICLERATEQAGNALLLGILATLADDTPSDENPPGFITSPPAAPAWCRLTTYIQEHLHDPPDVNSLAEKAGYTRSHFSRLFRDQTGLSPRQYVINARMALAKELLRSTSMAVTDIAIRTGYTDVFQFSRQFKCQTDQSPSDYRARARESLHTTSLPM